MIHHGDDVDIKDLKLASDDRKQNENLHNKHSRNELSGNLCSFQYQIKKSWLDADEVDGICTKYFSELICNEEEKISEALKTDSNHKLKEIFCEDEVDCKVLKIDWDFEGGEEAKKKEVLEHDKKYREQKRTLLVVLKTQAPLLIDIQILVIILRYLKVLFLRSLCPYDENLETIRRILQEWNQEKTYNNLMALAATRPAFDIPEGYEHLNEIFKLFKEDYYFHSESAIIYATSIVLCKTHPVERIKNFFKKDFKNSFANKHEVIITSPVQEKNFKDGSRFCSDK